MNFLSFLVGVGFTLASVAAFSNHQVKSSFVANLHGGSVLRATIDKEKIATTEEIMQDYKENVMNTYGRYPLAISRGSGVKLFDTEGKEYLDFAAGIATCCLGHSSPALKQAIIEQMDKVHHCSNLYYIPQQAQLAKWLVKNSCADRVFFCNSGAEANEAAIKLARKYAHTQRNIDFPIIITAKNSFHGRTLTAITATGQPKYQKNFGPLTPGFEYVTYNDLPELEALVRDIQGRGGGQGLAAIMMEPLQGEGGIRPGDAAFFQGARRLCDETGALLLMDEVQTGVGRTGKMWAHMRIGVEPDVFTSAKAIGGGIPLGAMLCKAHCDVFLPGDHASTYGGNPLACAAGLAVAAAFDKDGLLENVQQRSAQFDVLAAELQRKHPTLIEEFRGWGLMRGMQLTTEASKEHLTAAVVTKGLMDRGLLVVPAGVKVVRFVPPLIVSKEEMQSAFDMLDSVLSTLS